MAQATRCGLLFYPPPRTDNRSLPFAPTYFQEGIMLVLTRKKDESIVIGDNITITIVEVRGDKVRLGINAPIEIPVHRMEVYEAIQGELTKNSEKETDTSSKIS